MADKIASFGGQPTTEPRPVPQTTDPRQMLANVLAALPYSITTFDASQLISRVSSRNFWKGRSSRR